MNRIFGALFLLVASTGALGWTEIIEEEEPAAEAVDADAVEAEGRINGDQVEEAAAVDPITGSAEFTWEEAPELAMEERRSTNPDEAMDIRDRVAAVQRARAAAGAQAMSHDAERQMSAGDVVDGQTTGIVSLSSESKAWPIAGQSTLKDTLEYWATIEGWSVEWETDINYRINLDATMYGEFEDVVKQVMKMYASRERPLTAMMARGNLALVIREAGGKR